jgi:polyhydroxyalkanoate synthase subunit PhaC
MATAQRSSGGKPRKTTAPLPDTAMNFGHAIGDTLSAVAGLNLPVDTLASIQSEYLEEARQLWNGALCAGTPASDGLKDRRFSSGDWKENPASSFTAAMYLLNSRTMLKLSEALQGDEKTRQRIRFTVQQWLDAAAPSNYLAFNPEVQRKAIETQGESLAAGVLHLIRDMQQGHVSQTDETQFEVGRNVAFTEGAVVYENEFFQLLEYKPLTPKVHEKPLLLVPPCINKFYILDLQAENSFVRHAVAQGHRVFLVSWINADESMSKVTWDDYIEQGAIQAIHEVQGISRQKQINVLGFCVGGTIVTTALAVLAARGEKPAASLTLLTTLLDFSHTGILDLFVDEALVQLREMSIGPDSPAAGGLLKGQELASTFSFLRPNELVWNYVVGNYLKGETPPPFDLLYWNSDSTNLPGPMYCWYLRPTYLENQLRQPGALTVCGEKVDLGKLDMPVYIYASREDHIVPWESAYASTKLLSGKKRFILGASGHIAGVINPPAKKKRNYWELDKLQDQPEAWLDKAKEVPGSWWPDWDAWLASHAGKTVAAPKQYGDAAHPALEAAPGRYVKAKA